MCYEKSYMKKNISIFNIIQNIIFINIYNSFCAKKNTFMQFMKQNEILSFITKTIS